MLEGEVMAMKRQLTIWAISFALVLLNSLSFAQEHFVITPSIKVSENYDSNIFLSNTNEFADYVTVVTPGISLSLLKEQTDLKLSYAPSFVWYENLEDNFTRHAANLSFGQDLAERLRLALSDTYLKSEDPLEDPQNVQGLRQTRNVYWTNVAQGSLNYIFGAENEATAGYIYRKIENEQITLDDSEYQDPYFRLTYWFDVKNGTEFRYGYTDAKFTRDDNRFAAVDYTAHKPGIRYIRRFNPNSRAFIRYNYSSYDYDRTLPQDFVVHDGAVGLEHSFSPEYTVAASAGYFIRVNELTDNQDGPDFTASLTRIFPGGSITAGAAGGWSYEVLQQGFGLTSSGFSEYYQGFVNGSYHVLEPLKVYAGASYRHDKYTLSESDFYSFNAGLEWTFLRWFGLTLAYNYAERDQDIDIEDYKDHRVILLLSASKPYYW